MRTLLAAFMWQMQPPVAVCATGTCLPVHARGASHIHALAPWPGKTIIQLLMPARPPAYPSPPTEAGQGVPGAARVHWLR